MMIEQGVFFDLHGKNPYSVRSVISYVYKKFEE